MTAVYPGYLLEMLLQPELLLFILGLFDARTISPCWGTTTIYKVRSGLYYRFRFMNTGKETPYIMEIQRVSQFGLIE